MSIIQEALKKVGKPEVPGEEKHEEKPVISLAIKAPSGEEIGPKYVYYVISAVLLIILAGIIIRISYFPPSGIPVSAPAVKKLAPILPKIERREEPMTPPRRREGIGGFVLEGIMQLVDGPRAIINDIIVGEGETVNGAKVEKIKKDGVLLKYNDSEMVLGINE